MAGLRKEIRVSGQTPEEVAAAVFFNAITLEVYDSVRVYVKRTPTADSKIQLFELKMNRGRRKKDMPQELSVRPPIRVQILQR